MNWSTGLGQSIEKKRSLLRSKGDVISEQSTEVHFTVLADETPSATPSAPPSATATPTEQPTIPPTASMSPSVTPSSVVPTVSPSVFPSVTPSVNPSVTPSNIPTIVPSQTPTVTPTVLPTFSIAPTCSPSVTPSVAPSMTPSTPTVTPTVLPTLSIAPTCSPSVTPSVAPSMTPSVTPSNIPTIVPSQTPTVTPTVLPTLSIAPTCSPSVTPTVSPTLFPTGVSTAHPTATKSEEEDVSYSVWQTFTGISQTDYAAEQSTHDKVLADTLAALLPAHNLSITSVSTAVSAGIVTLVASSVSINYTLTFRDTRALGFASGFEAYNATSYQLFTYVQSGYFDDVYASAAFFHGAASLYDVTVVPSAYTQMFSAPNIEDTGGDKDEYEFGANIIIAIVVVGVLLLAWAVTMVLRSVGCLPSSEN
eukprot:gene24844-30020_t